MSENFEIFGWVSAATYERNLGEKKRNPGPRQPVPLIEVPEARPSGRGRHLRAGGRGASHLPSGSGAERTSHAGGCRGREMGLRSAAPPVVHVFSAEASGARGAGGPSGVTCSAELAAALTACPACAATGVRAWPPAQPVGGCGERRCRLSSCARLEVPERPGSLRDAATVTRAVSDGGGAYHAGMDRATPGMVGASCAHGFHRPRRC